MTEDAVREKIRKLMALAMNEGAADNEAETAMRQAEKLMRKHKIDLASIHQHSGTKPIYQWKAAFVPSSWPKPVNQCPLWFQWIGIGIGHLTDTRVMVLSQRRPIKQMGLTFEGDETDVEYAVWLAERIREEIRTRAAMYQAPGASSDEKWANREEFRHAMARRIKDRLMALHEEQKDALKKATEGGTGTALVLVEDKIKQRDAQFGVWVTSQKKVSHIRGTFDAHHAGNQAGDQVSLHRPLGKGQEKLK